MENDQGDPITYFNPWEKTNVFRNHLPHWDQPGSTYFVTWRLADSIPQDLFQRLRDEKEIWLKNHPEPLSNEEEIEFHRAFSAQLDRWMDEGHGSCRLRIPAIAKIVSSAFSHFDGSRYVMHCFVVMPNHVHLLFTTSKDYRLSKTIHSWKSFTATEINRSIGSEGKEFWQKDYFDRLIRNRQHFANCVKYIRNNSGKAKLSEGEFIFYQSEFASKIE